MSSSYGNTRKLPQRELIALDSAQSKLASVWFIGSAFIFVVTVGQSLLGHFGSQAKEAWEWLLPNLLPTIGLIVAALSHSALDATQSSSLVRRNYYHLAMWLSVFYLVLLLASILVQPFTNSSPLEVARTSNLWLGPLQGIVASALGILFVSKQKASEEERGHPTRTAA